MNNSKKSLNRKLLIIFAVVIIIGCIGYHLFIPEYARSKSTQNAFVYVKDGCFDKKYTINYDDEYTINIKNSNFSILLPYNHTITYDWKLISKNEDTKLMNAYIKKCRTPIYDRHREGTDYSMKIFEFNNEKSADEKLVFKYSSTTNPDSEESNKIIINLKYE